MSAEKNNRVDLFFIQILGNLYSEITEIFSQDLGVGNLFCDI